MNQQINQTVRQIDIFEKLNEIKIEEKSYRNGLGQLLPWEEPEYLRKESKHVVEVKNEKT